MASARSGALLRVVVLVAVLALLFLLPWALALDSLAAALRYGWPGPYALAIAELRAREELLGFGLAGGAAAAVLVGAVLLIGAAARHLGLPAVRAAVAGGAVVLAVPTLVALLLG